LSAATRHNRRLVLGLAAAVYVAVFVAFVFFERGGLGIAHFYYVPICMVALVTDGIVGATTGVLTGIVYALGVVVARGEPFVHSLGESTAIRLATYALVGALVGAYASRNRALLDQLRAHARQDFLTHLDNARVFDEELTRHCARSEPFTLVLADLEGLGSINDAHGHESGNDALRRVADALREVFEDRATICRIGGDEFALLTELPGSDVAGLCVLVSRLLAPEGLRVSFGKTVCPDDGTTSVELFRKADDRLFAAKLLRKAASAQTLAAV
jgi:diguanylate cyclase (GGDEF)-like protein